MEEKKNTLPNKPLAEAIFELRWQLPQSPVNPSINTDPNYKLLVGTLYDKVKGKFSFHESLPASALPEEIASYIVQHRFRNENVAGWPIIQLGPGILTFNETQNYHWETFEPGINFAVESLYGAYPSDNLSIKEVALRYINAFKISEIGENAFEFIREKMKLNFEVPENLFTETGVSNAPKEYDLRFSFLSTRPNAEISIRYGKGKSGEEEALIWEIFIKSNIEQPLNNKDGIAEWVKSAHTLVENWFFKIVDGALLEQFK